LSQKLFSQDATKFNFGSGSATEDAVKAYSVLPDLHLDYVWEKKRKGGGKSWNGREWKKLPLFSPK